MTDSRTRDMMNAIAAGLDDVLNGPPEHRAVAGRKVGFVVHVFPFGEADGRTNYVSNGERADVAKAMRSWLRQQAEGKDEAHPDPLPAVSLEDAVERAEWWLSTLHAGEPAPDPAAMCAMLRKAHADHGED